MTDDKILKLKETLFKSIEDKLGITEEMKNSPETLEYIEAYNKQKDFLESFKKRMDSLPKPITIPKFKK